MGGILLILVIMNAFVTGWLLATVRRMRLTMVNLANGQKDLAHDLKRKRRIDGDDSEEYDWE